MSDSTALDHLVYATPDLDGTVGAIASALGVEPSPGGRHVGRGTRNYLLSLGSGSYHEIIGIDPEQPDHSGSVPFGIDRLTEPRLVSWAVRVRGIDEFVARACHAGYDPGEVESMSRDTPEGRSLRWKLTRTSPAESRGVIPFVIDWGDTPHPSATTIQRGTLDDFHVEAADAPDVSRIFDILGIQTRVIPAAADGLKALLRGPLGTLALE